MKTGQDIIAICKGCSKKVPMGSLRYHRQSGEFVCPSCFQAEPKEKEVHVEIPNQKERITYKCSSCGYSFSRNADFTVTGICFNCGKETIAPIHKVSAAEKLVKNIDDELFSDSKKL